MIEELVNLLGDKVTSSSTSEFSCGDLDIIELEPGSLLVDGFSPYVDLPRKFVYTDINVALPVIHPFILQALDGEPRI